MMAASLLAWSLQGVRFGNTDGSMRKDDNVTLNLGLAAVIVRKRCLWKMLASKTKPCAAAKLEWKIPDIWIDDP